MELAFETKDLRAICESSLLAFEKLGGEAAITLMHRLSDMNAASKMEDLLLLPISPRLNNGSGENNLITDLCNGKKMIFTHNHRNPPLNRGKIDWPQVTRIKILEISNNE